MKNLFVTCDKCEGSRVIDSPEWQEYDRLYSLEIEPLENNVSLKEFNERVTAFDQEHMPRVPLQIYCPKCLGTGRFPTEEGADILNVILWYEEALKHGNPKASVPSSDSPTDGGKPVSS